MANRLVNKSNFILAVLLLPALAFTQGVPGGTKGPAAKPAGKTAAQAAEAVPAAAAKYENGNRRDPFLNLLLLKKENESKQKAADEEIGNGNAPPGVAGMYVAQIVLMGISASDEKRTAVFRGTDKRAYFLQDGDKVFDGYVKKIGTDDVLMIRETKFRSGKVATQEVTKRLRTP